MKNIINNFILLLVLSSVIISYGQNTAVTSGNWDSCATWGNPASILQNNTDTKTISNGITVIQNATWSTKTVDFAGGNGSITLATSANTIDLVNDGGDNKSCNVTPCPTPSSLAVTGSASSINAGSTASFTLSGTNISSTNWTISPSTGLSSSTGSTNSTGNITFANAGTYTITFTATSTGSCSNTTAQAAKTIIVNAPTSLCTAPNLANMCTLPSGQSTIIGISVGCTGNGQNQRLSYSGKGYTSFSVSINGNAPLVVTGIDPNVCQGGTFFGPTYPGQISGTYVVTYYNNSGVAGCTENSSTKTGTLVPQQCEP